MIDTLDIVCAYLEEAGFLIHHNRLGGGFLMIHNKEKLHIANVHVAYGESAVLDLFGWHNKIKNIDLHNPDSLERVLDWLLKQRAQPLVHRDRL